MMLYRCRIKTFLLVKGRLQNDSEYFKENSPSLMGSNIYIVNVGNLKKIKSNSISICILVVAHNIEHDSVTWATVLQIYFR